MKPIKRILDWSKKSIVSNPKEFKNKPSMRDISLRTWMWFFDRMFIIPFKNKVRDEYSLNINIWRF